MWQCFVLAKTKSSLCLTAALTKAAHSQGIVHGTSVACPLHNWNIGLADGCAKAPDEGCTPKFAVQIKDGEVYLDTAELASHAVEETRPIAGPARRTVPA
jgi:nitrite reductase (NADH) small subunit